MNDLRIGMKYKLCCGHLGSIVGIYGGNIAVKGNTQKRCSGCSKKHVDGDYWERMPTVFIISKEEGGE